MPVIFVSYRRQDSEATAYRIYDRLVQSYGRDSVLIDIDSINPGDDFPAHINELLSKCDIMAAVVGREWAGRARRKKGGASRLDEPND
jgi:TIR domain